MDCTSTNIFSKNRPSQSVPARKTVIEKMGTFDHQDITIQFLHGKPHHPAKSGPLDSKWIQLAMDMARSTRKVHLNGASNFIDDKPEFAPVVCRHIVALGLRNLIVQWSQGKLIIDRTRSIFTKQEIDDLVKDMHEHECNALYRCFERNALRVDFCDGSQFREVIDDHFRKMDSSDVKLLMVDTEGTGQPGLEKEGHAMYAVLLKVGEKCSIFFCDPNFDKWKHAQAQPLYRDCADSKMEKAQDDPWLVSQFFCVKAIDYGARKNGICVYEVDPDPALIGKLKELHLPAGNIRCELDTLMKCYTMLASVPLSNSAGEDQWRQLGKKLTRALSGKDGQKKLDSAIYIVRLYTKLQRSVRMYDKFFSEVKIGKALDAAASAKLKINDTQGLRLFEELFTRQDPHSLVATGKEQIEKSIKVEVMTNFFAVHYSLQLDKDGKPAFSRLVKFFGNVAAMSGEQVKMIHEACAAPNSLQFEKLIREGIFLGVFTEHPAWLETAGKLLEFLRKLDSGTSDIKEVVGVALEQFLMPKRQSDAKATVTYEDVVATLNRGGLFKDSHDLAAFLGNIRSSCLKAMFRAICLGTRKPEALRYLIGTLSSPDLKPEFRWTPDDLSKELAESAKDMPESVESIVNWTPLDPTILPYEAARIGSEEFADRIHAMVAILNEAGIVGSDACNVLAGTRDAAIAFLSLGITEPMQTLMNAIMRVEPGSENPDMLKKLKDRIVDSAPDLIKQRRVESSVSRHQSRGIRRWRSRR